MTVEKTINVKFETNGFSLELESSDGCISLYRKDTHTLIGEINLTDLKAAIEVLEKELSK